MKKFALIAFTALLCAANAMAIPANPRWLHELAEQGDQTTLQHVLNKQARVRAKANTMLKAPGQVQTAMPLNIAPRGLIILVNFSDLSWTKATHAEMDSMINGQNYTRNYSYTYQGETYRVTSSGSAKKYFYDSSFGQYNPQFTVVGPVTVSRGYAYYGGNTSDGDDSRPEEMVAEACQLANSQVDFSQFDNDGDGDIDFVYIFYAGNQESDGAGDDYIWPHSYSLDSYYYLSTRQGGLGNAAVRLDGKRLNKYACSGEIEYYSNKHDGIGTFCHEFSHVLGLPDLYVTDYNSTHKTMGLWDILDAGPYNNEGNTPPLYSAYERFFMGWLTPTVINQPGTYTLQSSTTHNEAYLICAGGQHNLVGNDPNPTTFYMLENRQLTGWDEALPGHGLMLTKIQYSYSKWSGNTVNNSSSSMGVDLIEADGRAPSASEYNPNNGYYGKAGDLFPTGATQYNKITNYPITNISESNGVVSFTVGGSGENPDPGPNPDPDPTPGGDGNCDNYSWTASQRVNWGDIFLNDYDWTVHATNEDYCGYESNRGAQFGSKKSPAGQLSLSTNEVSACLISSIQVNAARASRGNAQLSVYINGTQVGSTINLESAAENYTFSNTANLIGTLEIRIANTSGASYLKSIQITQTSTATGVTLEAEQKAKKIWENGRLVIIRDGKRYDVLGRKM